MTKLNVEVGKVFGFLEVVAVHNEHWRGNSWLCRCVCGKEKVLYTSHLIGVENRKPTRSCGCKHKTQGGYSVKYPKLYFAWTEMVKRCYDASHDSRAYYLDKGIQVKKEWRDDFKVFVEWSLENGYEEHLTLDRINSDGNYSPENCRWTNDLIQAQNRGIHKDNKTGVNGSRRMPNGRYQAYISRNHKRYNLGMYDTISEVKEARRKAEEFYEEHGTLEGYKPQWKRLRKPKRGS